MTGRIATVVSTSTFFPPTMVEDLGLAGWQHLVDDITDTFEEEGTIVGPILWWCKPAPLPGYLALHAACEVEAP